LEIKILVHFLRVKKIGGKLVPLPMPFFPQTHPIKILIAILLKIVHKSDNKSSGVNTAPQSPMASVLSYATQT
jgi:hypothetical protein